jgi:hypothetical protein
VKGEGNYMKYYFWVNGYENAGIVKANTLEEAKEKVIISQGNCGSINCLDNEEYDRYDVVILIS